MAASQFSDCTGAGAVLDKLPKAKWMLANRGYGANWHRNTPQAEGILPGIPGRKRRNIPIEYEKRRYRCWSRIEIMFGRLNDSRYGGARYDRWLAVFFCAISLAATVVFWL